MASTRTDSIISRPEIIIETAEDNISKQEPSLTHGRSSTSSIDSISGKNVNINGKDSSAPKLSIQTSPSITTDSDFDSEQDDNNPLQEEKNNSNPSERLSSRLRRFRKLFKSEIPDHVPSIISSYVCAYQGDILLQGKMFITDKYLCFHSRIINYVTKHVYRWEQIESVRKERVAFIFPTAIAIQLKPTGKKIVYASFLLRDQAFEKIHSIWTKYKNEISSNDDDDSNDLPQDGTLKANNQYDKSKYSNRETNNENDQNVLQMYLKNNSRRTSPISGKNLDDKQSNKKLINSYEKKNSNQDQTIRNSRYIKNEQKLHDTTKRKHRSQSGPRNNPSYDQTDENISYSNSSSVTIPEDINSNGSLLKIFNIILSILSQIRPYISSIFPSYPMKTMLIILLTLTILFFHSFYLIKLAYRIENRLESLRHVIPSSSFA